MTGTRRGSHLLDAALVVVAEAGLAGLSVRTVAARAGASPAQVQYYFPSKTDLVAAAYQHASGQYLAAVGPELAGPRTVARLRRILWAWLPLTPEAERRARVWLAFAAAAVIDPDLAASAAAIDAGLRRWLTDELGALQDGGASLPGSPEDAASQLLALLDGTTVHVLLHDLPDRAGLAERTLGGWLGNLGS